MIGSVFEGRYTINGFLSEGPVFTLYSARDKLTNKDVSLRLIKPPFDSENPFKQALSSAMEQVSVIQSPLVERLLHLSEEGGKSFLIGELTRAPSLADRIRKLAPVTPPVGVACAISIARGLEAFHKFNLVHGDVSGENVAMLGDGEVRLQLGGVWTAYSASATAGVLVLPTLAPYLAPEVSHGELPNAVSDLYSAGILLFELLTGRKPYQADTGLATAMRHTTEETPRVRTLNPSIPAALDEIVFKMMSKDPESRYQKASEFIFDLRQTQDALRFGRNLSWPIKPEPAAQKPTQRIYVAPRVAPKMSAIRPEEAKPEKPKKSKEDRDVPIWMISLLGLCAVTAIGLVGLNFLLGATSPRMEKVPDLRGLTFEEAKGVAKQMKLKVRIASSLSDDKVEANYIIDSTPPKGDKLPDNSTIAVNISLGPKDVAVPKLIGLTLDKARQTLRESNLELEDPPGHGTDSSVPVGTVCKQIPAVGLKIARSGKVRVLVNDQPSDNQDSKPKSYAYHIRVTVPKDIPKDVEVRIEMSDDDGTRDLYDETKSPGSTVRTEAQGNSEQATFSIYYDDQLVEKHFYNKGQEDGDPVLNPYNG